MPKLLGAAQNLGLSPLRDACILVLQSCQICRFWGQDHQKGSHFSPKWLYLTRSEGPLSVPKPGPNTLRLIARTPKQVAEDRMPKLLGAAQKLGPSPRGLVDQIDASA